MAREVNTVLAKIMAEQRGIPEAKAEEIVKSMRSANQYQVCLSINSPPDDLHVNLPPPLSPVPGFRRWHVTSRNLQTNADISFFHRKTSGRRLIDLANVPPLFLDVSLLESQPPLMLSPFPLNHVTIFLFVIRLAHSDQIKA